MHIDAFFDSVGITSAGFVLPDIQTNVTESFERAFNPIELLPCALIIFSWRQKEATRISLRRPPRNTPFFSDHKPLVKGVLQKMENYQIVATLIMTENPIKISRIPMSKFIKLIFA